MTIPASEELGALPTESANPASAGIDLLPTIQMLEVINNEDARVAAAVRTAIPQIAAAVDQVAARFAQGGRLFYVGAGTSGRLGVLDASECPPTFSVPPTLFIGLIAGGDSALRRSSESSEDSPEAGAADLLPFALTSQDTVVGIAASGRTPYVLGALAHARSHSALTVALTCAGGSTPASPLANAADIPIELATGAEVLTGSTRMKAGTATKLVLNMLSTGIMVRSGAVYGNLMVNVQPTNAKLVDRAERIIAAITGCQRQDAASLLAATGSVKVSVVMHQLSIDKQAAVTLLERHGGHLAESLRPR